MAFLILQASSFALAGLGAALLFFPGELAALLAVGPTGTPALQLASAGALGFAILNWSGRGAIYGGIYGRPIVAANLWHGVVATLVLVRWQVDSGGSVVGWGVTAMALAYAGAFTVLLLDPPFAAGRGGSGSRRGVLGSVLAALAALTAACGPSASPGGAPRGAGTAPSSIDAVVIHPPVAAEFQCSEHPLGQEDHAGDALAADCRVVRGDGGPLGNFPRFYSGEGTRNEDWFSWNEPLLAPFDGVVKAVLANPVTNQPGTRGPDPSSAVLFERLGDTPAAPVQVGYVHVQEVQVEVGDTVRAGQVVARIGNNGNSTAPHVHVGALRGDLTKLMSGEIPPEEVVPLQVRFDLEAMGRLRGYVP